MKFDSRMNLNNVYDDSLEMNYSRQDISTYDISLLHDCEEIMLRNKMDYTKLTN